MALSSACGRAAFTKAKCVGNQLSRAEVWTRTTAALEARPRDDVSATVDFDRLAGDAVEAGLFRPDAAAVRANMFIIHQYARLPVTLLDAPYGNGPMAIRVFKQDIPEAAVYAVRRNFVEANALLMPLESVMRYFHQRFVADEVFRSKSLATLIALYRAPRVDPYHDASIDAVLGTTAKPDEISFRVEGVDRATHDRRLYTHQEQVAGLQLVQTHPEVVLTILAYQAVLLDYLAALRAAFARLASEPEMVISSKDLADVDGYANQWRTNNFTDELVPAMAIFYQHRLQANVPPDDCVDGTLFGRAVGFILDNGAFRNWVTIPHEVARDQKEHIDHFLCPAVGPVRMQLLDGTLLERIYGIVRQKRERNDRLVRRFAAHVIAEASEKYRNKDREPVGAERGRLEEPLQIAFENGVHEIPLDARFALFMSGRQQADDVVIELPKGIVLSDALRAAVSASAEWGSAVFFGFNGRGYRVTLERLRQFLATTAGDSQQR